MSKRMVVGDLVVRSDGTIDAVSSVGTLMPDGYEIFYGDRPVELNESWSSIVSFYRWSHKADAWVWREMTLSTAIASINAACDRWFRSLNGLWYDDEVSK